MKPVPSAERMLTHTYADLLDHGLTLACHCWRCKRWHDVDLAAIVQAGRGDEVYVGKKPRCMTCGERGAMQIQPRGGPIGTG